MAEDEKSLEEEEFSEDEKDSEEDTNESEGENSEKESGDVEEIRELDSDEFPGIRKKAYQENENPSISQERDRLKELLDQTEISSGDEDKKIRTENLERIAISAPPVSGITSGGQDTAYEESSTPYVENNVYQASSAYQSKNYEEMKHPTNNTSQMQDPKHLKLIHQSPLRILKSKEKLVLPWDLNMKKNKRRENTDFVNYIN